MAGGHFGHQDQINFAQQELAKTQKTQECSIGIRWMFFGMAKHGQIGKMSTLGCIVACLYKHWLFLKPTLNKSSSNWSGRIWKNHSNIISDIVSIENKKTLRSHDHSNTVHGEVLKFLRFNQLPGWADSHQGWSGEGFAADEDQFGRRSEDLELGPQVMKWPGKQCVENR